MHYIVHWANVGRDGAGEIRHHHGWRSKEFLSSADALAFARELRAERQSGIAVIDNLGNRIEDTGQEAEGSGTAANEGTRV